MKMARENLLSLLVLAMFLASLFTVPATIASNQHLIPTQFSRFSPSQLAAYPSLSYTNISVGESPELVYPINGYVYVVNTKSDSIAVISGTQVIANISLSQYISQSFFSRPDLTFLYDNISGYIYVTAGLEPVILAIKGTELVKVINLSSGVEFPFIDYKNGYLYVSTLNSIYIINGTNVIERIQTIGATIIRYDKYNGYIYASTVILPSSAYPVYVINGTEMIANISINVTPRSVPFHIYITPNYVYILYISYKGNLQVLPYKSYIAVLNGTKLVDNLEFNGALEATYDSKNNLLYVLNYTPQTQLGSNEYLVNASLYVINGSNIVGKYQEFTTLSLVPLPFLLAYYPYTSNVYLAYVNNSGYLQILILNRTTEVKVVSVNLNLPSSYLTTFVGISMSPYNIYIYGIGASGFSSLIANYLEIINPYEDQIVGSLQTYSITGEQGYINNIYYPPIYLSNYTYFFVYNNSQNATKLYILSGAKVINTLSINATPYDVVSTLILTSRPESDNGLLWPQIPYLGPLFFISTPLYTEFDLSPNQVPNYVPLIASNNSLILVYGDRIIGTAPLGKGLHFMAYSYEDNMFYVTSSLSNLVTAITTITYNLTFVESGLPIGTKWYVYIQGNGISENISSTSNTLTVSLPPGSYEYQIYSPYYVPSIAQGTIMLTSSQIINVTFSPIQFTLTFIENGLPMGTIWGVIINGKEYTTSNNELTLSLPYDIYQIEFLNVTGYANNVTSLVLTLNKNVVVYVAYYKLEYNLTVIEYGLPFGTKWGIVINGSEYTTTENYIKLTLPLGLYEISFLNVSGYKLNVTSELIPLYKSTVIYVAYAEIQSSTTSLTTPSSVASSTTSSATTSTINSTSSNVSTTAIVGGIIIAVIIIVIIIVLFLLRRK